MSLSSLDGILKRSAARGEALSGRSSGPIHKSLTDYAELAVGPVYRHTVAEWILDRNMFVRQYRNSVAIGVGTIARKMAMQEIKVLRRYFTKSGPKVEPADQTLPICELFRNINPIFTEWDLWYYTEGWKMLTGNAYWWKGRNLFGLPTELWVIPSQWVRAIPSRTQFIGAYEIRNLFRTEHPVILPGTEINQLDEPNLDQNANGRFYGQPPIIPAAASIDIEDKMFDRLRWKQTNFAEPGQIFSTDKPLTEYQLRQIYNQIVNQHTLVEHTGRPMITHSGLKPMIPTSARRELDFKDSFDVTMTLILAIFGVPKAICGLVSDQNRANAEAALLTFCENCINPRLKHNSLHLTKSLAREFEPDGSLFCHFEPCTINDVEELRKTVETCAKEAAITPNEIREILLKKGRFVRGGDRPTLPSAAIMAGWGNDDGTTPEPGLEPPIKTSVPNLGIPGQTQPDGDQSDAPNRMFGAGDGLFSGNGDSPIPRVASSSNGNGKPGMFGRRKGLFKADHSTNILAVRDWERTHLEMQEPFGRAVHQALQKIKSDALSRFRTFSGIKKAMSSVSSVSSVSSNGNGRHGMFGHTRLHKSVGPDAVNNLIPRGKTERILMDACDDHIFAAAVAGSELELKHIHRITTSLTAVHGPKLVTGLVALPSDLVDAIRDHVHETFGLDYWLLVTEATRDMLRDTLTRSVTEGWTGPETVDFIVADKDHVFDEVRAKKVVQTETTGAVNSGQYIAQERFMDSGEIDGRTWSGILDQRIRNSHRQADGQQIIKRGGTWVCEKNGDILATGREFVVGTERARFAGDPELSPENRINCRCLTLSLVE